MREPLLKRGRKWFRFRLRTLMALVTVLALVMAWIANERHQSAFELQFAEQLFNQGFSHTAFGGPYDSNELRSLGKPQTWWRTLAQRVLGERIIFSGDPAADFKNLQLFANLSSLQMLCLDHTRISDLTPLTNYKTLCWISLNDTEVNDLAPLAKLPGLQELYIASAQVSDLTPLAGLKRLKYLSIGGTRVRDLTPLAGLTNLRVLYAQGVAVDREQVAALQKALPNCKIRHSPPSD
jgi:hypothetical protein